MLGLGIVGLLIGIALIVWYLVSDKSGYYNDHWVKMLGGCILTFIVLIANGVIYTDQVSDLEYLKNVTKYEAIDQTRIDQLLPQLKEELKRYPDYEEKVLAAYASGKGSLVLLPPELKADKIVCKIADTIESSYEELYKDKYWRANTEKDIAVRSRAGRLWAIYIPSE